MTAPEQKARELHARISIRHAHHKWTNPSDEQLQELADLIAERDALKAELNCERARLAACGVVASADTPESAAMARKMPKDHESVSCFAVARRVDDCIRLKAELAAIKGAGEPVAWGQLGMLNGKTYLRENWDRSPYPPPPSIVKNLNLVPLYTRPCVPLTDKQIFASEEIRAANAEIGLLFSSLLKLVRAIEAAHNIKGVKE